MARVNCLLKSKLRLLQIKRRAYCIFHSGGSGTKIHLIIRMLYLIRVIPLTLKRGRLGSLLVILQLTPAYNGNYTSSLLRFLKILRCIHA
jgi:hypothetical protein